MILMFIGLILTLGLLNAKDIRRPDGSRVITMKNPSWLSEFKGLLQVLKTDSYIVLLFPMFWSSNWFTTYQFSCVNLPMFTIRTRSLNNVLYWLFQMVGALAFGYLLDIPYFRRTTRARGGLFLLFVLTMGVWAGGYAFQTTYTRDWVDELDAAAAVLETTSDHRMDWSESRYIGPMFLYIIYGFYDAAFQTCAYWYVFYPNRNKNKDVSNSMQVHGIPHQQLPQTGHVCRFLQGHPVRRCRRYLGVSLLCSYFTSPY